MKRTTHVCIDNSVQRSEDNILNAIFVYDIFIILIQM